MFLRAFFFVSFVSYIFCHDEDVHTVQYTKDDFATEIAKKNHFVMFFAPWCGHCQRLGPTWEQLAEMLNEDDSNVRIAKVDCTTDNEICSEQDVTGYPTLKFFKLGSGEGVKFRGTRDLPTLTSFINEQLGNEEEQNVSKIPEPVNGLLELTEDTFEKHVASGKHFVKFYAPWCGHCQKLAPVWEELAASLEKETSIGIAKIDCTQYRSVCNQFDIKGYPTLLWIEDGKKIEKYQGQRGHEELKNYVMKMLGSVDDGSADFDKVEDDASDPVIVLSGINFEKGIELGTTFVKFFAPWCGHCKRLAPTWEELGKKFQGNSNIKIAKVDCTAEASKELCREQEVDGFPTMLIFKDGKKLGEYNGNRSLEDLLAYVTKQHNLSRDEL